MKPRIAGILLLVLALGGMVDAGFLTWDHLVFQVDPTGATGICERGAGCEISRYSSWSEIRLGGELPGVPISLIGLACYLAVAVLGVWRMRRPHDRDVARLLLVVAGGSVAYSALLAYVTLRIQDQLCPYCTVLYGVNLAMLIVAWASRGEPLLSALGNAPRAILRRPGLVALLVFLATLGAGYAAYVQPILEARAEHRADQLERAKGIEETETVSLDVAERPTVGPDDAPVHIVEFADLECPHCRSLWEALHEVREGRPGEVRVTFVHFPLDDACNPSLERPFHRDACRLAVAAECAHRQERFDAMASWLFEQGGAATREDIEGEAKAMGMDLEAYGACLDSDDALRAVKDDIVLGLDHGVRGTPIFFVDGHRVDGARPAPVVDAMVDEILGQGGGAGE
ncbi:MAG: vitamin K epoxide reductase family protein [Myxococcota bacterium]